LKAKNLSINTVAVTVCANQKDADALVTVHGVAATTNSLSTTSTRHLLG